MRLRSPNALPRMRLPGKTPSIVKAFQFAASIYPCELTVNFSSHLYRGAGLATIRFQWLGGEIDSLSARFAERVAHAYRRKITRSSTGWDGKDNYYYNWQIKFTHQQFSGLCKRLARFYYKQKHYGVGFRMKDAEELQQVWDLLERR